MWGTDTAPSGSLPEASKRCTQLKFTGFGEKKLCKASLVERKGRGKLPGHFWGGQGCGICFPVCGGSDQGVLGSSGAALVGMGPAVLRQQEPPWHPSSGGRRVSGIPWGCWDGVTLPKVTPGARAASKVVPPNGPLPFPPCQDPDVKIPEIRAERSNPGAQEVALESVPAVSGSHLALVFGLGGRTGACPAPAAPLDPPFSSPPSHSCWELSAGVLLLLHVQGFAPDRCSTASDLPSPAFSLYKTGRCQN